MFKAFLKERKEAKQKHNIFNQQFKNYNSSGINIWMEISAMCQGHDDIEILARDVHIQTINSILNITFNNTTLVRSKFTTLKAKEEKRKEEELLYTFFKKEYNKIIEKLVLSHNINCFEFY
ncbi:MAG TPA: hypothetical protein VIK86_03605 [Candidatus Paceibacterota bacterium]